MLQMLRMPSWQSHNPPGQVVLVPLLPTFKTLDNRLLKVLYYLLTAVRMLARYREEILSTEATTPAIHWLRHSGVYAWL
jgi:hypothetical protein